MVKIGNHNINLNDICFEHNTLQIIKARNSFMRTFLEQGAKYIGQLDKKDLTEDDLTHVAKNITGEEIWLEYHMFKMNGLPLIGQFRYTGTYLS